MSWHFSQALEEAYSAENSSDGAPFAPLSGTPTHGTFWSPGKTTDALSRSRSGMTYRPSTDSHGEAVLTWCLADSLVRTSPQPEKAQASPEREAACGRKWHASLARFDPASCSWKTHQYSLLGDLEPYSETWPQWGMMRDGECWELPMLAPPSTESESGYWQTPTTRDGKGQSGLGNRIKRGKPGKPHVANLCDQIVDIGRPDLVRCIEFRYRLMAWPIGWTGCEPLATDKFQQWLHSHGEYSTP